MRILRVRLRNYRGVEEHEVKFAPTGVTIVEGPNGIGKSSLAEAIDVVFEHKDRSRKEGVRALQPIHRDEGAEVEVDVECGPYAFTYHKRYHKNPSTTLTVTRPRPESHTGDEAHERAAEILREAVDLDLWRALRIHQGSAVDQAKLDGHRSLSQALDRAAGVSAAGEREESLFEAVRAESLKHYTETGKPRKEIEEAERTVAGAEAEAAQLAAKLRVLEGEIDRAGELEREIARLRSGEPFLVAALREREDRVNAIALLEADLGRLVAEHERAAFELRSAEAEATAREELVKRLARERGELAELEEKKEAIAPSLTAARVDAAAAESSLATARAGADELARLRDARAADRDFRNDEFHLQLLGERWTRVEKAVSAGREADDVLRSALVTAAALKEIESAHLEAALARSRLEAAGTSVEVEALNTVKALVGGEERDLARGEKLALAPRGNLEVLFPGLARVSVRPGAEPEALSAELRKAEAALQASLRKAGVGNVAEARAAHDRRREAERAKKAAAESLAENLRDFTRDTMDEAIRALRGRVDTFRASRAEAPPLPPDLDAANAMLARAVMELDEAEGLAQRTQKAHEAARTRRESVEREAAGAKAAHEVLAARQADALRILDAARAARPDADVLRARDDAALKRLHLDSAAKAARERLAAEQPEKARELAKNAVEALERSRSARDAAEKALIAVSSALKTKGEEGLAERLEEARGRLVRARADQERLLFRARAAKLLHDVMAEERDRARRAYVAPLKDRIERLGRIVYGDGFSVELGDELEVASRTLDGTTIPYASLNVGAKEQVGVIARLACAMIVSADGGVPVVLDDALGYSDARHLELMGAILGMAGRDAQVIVLTCMPERYRHVGGAKVVRLG